MFSLLIGVIRKNRNYRANNALAERADKEYKAKRPTILAKAGPKCVFCSYASKAHNQCHHLDGDHTNNDESNFAVVDTFCHAYQHLGEQANRLGKFEADSLGRSTGLAAIPEIAATDLNLLQRALGVALLDPAEAPIAQEILKRMGARVAAVTEAFGTAHVGDFAAGMAQMDEDSYAARESVVGSLRLLFGRAVLEHEGRRFMKDFSSMGINTWEAVARNASTERI